MRAWKGVSPDMRGHGGYQFEPGGVYEEPRAKTVSCGYHCTENPFACLAYFPLGMRNRYFEVEAEGSIDEDGNERIACSRMTFIREVTVQELAMEGMAYIIRHPDRDDWKRDSLRCIVQQDRAEASEKESIVIARGKDPMVRGREGSFLGLLREGENREIAAASAAIVGRRVPGMRGVIVKADIWYRMNEEGRLEEAAGEEKKD